MEFSKSFLEDEVRNGFYIPGMIKKSWAASLQVLGEIDKVCRKHGIQYHAEWGSMLGAVRHGGFIPWDDDLDIGMKREDYRRFCEVAAKELPEGYFLENIHTNPDFDLFLARVTSNTRISFDEEYLEKFHGFPYRIGVDIFVLDYVYADKEKEKERVDICKRMIAIGDGIYEGRYTGEKAEMFLQTIERELHTAIDRNKPLRQQIYCLVEEKFAEVTEEKAKEIVQMFPWGLKEYVYYFPKEYYDTVVYLPFEYTMIPVPGAYDLMLSRRYGEYMKIVRNVAGHDYPFFEKQKQNLEETMGFEVPDFITPSYKFRPEVLEARGCSKTEDANAYKVQLHHYCEIIEALQEAMKQHLANDDYNPAAIGEGCGDCQTCAIEMGNLLESIKGEGFATVRIIEQYCEAVYQLYNAVYEASGLEEVLVCLEALFKNWQRVKQSLKEKVFARREVVFLPFKAENWHTFEQIRKEEIKDPDCDVYVLPIPYFYKRYDGRLMEEEMQYHPESYPEELQVMSIEDFSLQQHHPDVIYFQNPYDAYHPSISVHPNFYSDKLKQFTEKLVYIPYFETEEFSADSYCENYNMRYYCSVPGVVYADSVWLQSDEMKKRYVEHLTKWAGEETRTVWEEKIEVKKPKASDEEQQLPKRWLPALEKADGSRKKIILYYVGISSFFQYKEKVFEKLEAVLEVFRKQQEDAVLLWHPQDKLLCVLQENMPDLVPKYENFLTKLQQENFVLCEEELEEKQLAKLCDAYFGDASTFFMEFLQLRKPVMKQDVMLTE